MEKFHELSNYPEWFREEVKSLKIETIAGADRQVMLSESRKDFAAAWSNFFSEVRSVVQLHVYIYTLVVAVVYFGLKDSPNQHWIPAVGGVLLFMSILIGQKSKAVLSATFALYVSSTIFSCQLHLAAGFATHRWFEMVWDVTNKNKESRMSKDELVNAWSGTGSTLKAYESSVTIFQRFSGVGGVALIVAALWPTFLEFVASR